ncbi:MAG: peptide deformylase [Acidimicrobiales bacterium]
MSSYAIRTYGDPVLRQRAGDVVEIDGRLKQLADDMAKVMYDAPGVGLAAPQIGVQKRVFVYDVGDGEGPRTIVNPVVSETRGEWTYEEGCLSVPGLSWAIVRPKEVHLTGYDLDGNEVSLEADEFLARVFQHEVDHLDGVLLIERLDEDQRRDAKRILRARVLDLPGDGPEGLPKVTGPAPDIGATTGHLGANRL